ncbi:MAG: TldD/PmbA family protein [Candidatus Sericytochromatia bacterium]|nr:TldD/PmbA family protein [Candidatus Sericytochromatia bacterium]
MSLAPTSAPCTPSQAVRLALQAAAELDAYVVARVQVRQDHGLLVINGDTEHLGQSRLRGIGVQAFTRDGHAGFAASDDLDAAADVTRQAVGLAREAARRSLTPNTAIFEVPPLVSHEPEASFVPPDLPRLEAALRALNAEVRALDPRLAVRTSLGQVHEAWHVGRSDGTDVSWVMQRARLSHEITARDGGRAATASAGVIGVDAGLLDDAALLARLSAQAVRQAALALRLLDAPRLRGGAYRLVIDHALAKGLAHEAFGHAAETDSMRTSILGDGGRFRRGERVAPDFVSIVDGPLPGDYAWQPISANGERRDTIHIVRDGVLDEALADTFSAAEAGARPTGAARAESYAALPMPRMTNTRIVVREPIPLADDPDTLSPEALRSLLLAHGLMAPGERVLFLSGYKGGQVNTSQGDFVFNCTAIHDLADGQLYQPAIFSGKVLSVLSAIRAGIGALRLDAPGMCGKRGQSVPSSGGCHAFLVIDAHPEVLVGGSL